MTFSEPWLRGVLTNIHPVTGHLVCAGEQIREEIDQALAPLDPADVWTTPHGMTSAGFHAKHLAGSTRRLCAYLEGRALSGEELTAIDTERTGEENSSDLIHLVNSAFEIYEEQVRALKPEDFATLRHVGRASLPVTAISLAIHIAEHGQRHLGQVISAAKLARALRFA
jgi:hypothetical protein